MITFLLSIILLLLGYFIYSRLIERWIGVDAKRLTPATTMADGVDYVPMKPWKLFLIQFLNISGLGPICGAIMGAQFGTASFLWIVFGCIFAGSVHDYVSGYMSLRNKGCSLPELHGQFLGKKAKAIMVFVTLFVTILGSMVFVNASATLLNKFLTPDWNIFIWIAIIFLYYILATLVPIDKLIGRIYPIFGLLLLVMALAIVAAIVINQPAIPEVWQGMENRHPDAAHNPLFPMMFVSIACGAISGFHGTQSPLMARCMINEKQARPTFYGAMITEGIVALIWAAAAAFFFGPDSPVDTAGKGGPAMVGVIANTWLPEIFAVICILGVVASAISTGDTAMRSARLIIADMLRIEQKSIKRRLEVAIPLFVVSLIVLVFSLSNPQGFDVIWRYMSWSNQMLAAVTMWSVTIYLVLNCKRGVYWISLFPALFMTMVSSCFLFVAENEGFGSVIPHWIGYSIGAIVTIASFLFFLRWKNSLKR